MTDVVRVGTRRSRLARAQTDLVLARLVRARPELRWEATALDTSGDRNLSLGSSPDFTDRIDRALLRGDVDLAVHSAKDLPVHLDPGLAIVACPPRADPRDCLIVTSPRTGLPLPRAARVGSSSLRRRAQLLRWRPDLRVLEIRGNVDTRLEAVRSGVIDAAIVAVAGVVRLGRAAEIGAILPPTSFLPAPAQGALAVVARLGDDALASAVHAVDHSPTSLCVRAERAFAAALGGDCHVPLGAWATHRPGNISVVGEVLSPDGRRSLRLRRRGRASEAERIGSELGKQMLDKGALDLLLPSR